MAAQDMPVFKRILSEFLFRRFMLGHYASNLLLDLNLEARREAFDYIKANTPDAPYFFHRLQQHEFRAFQEFVDWSGVKCEYMGFSVTGQQVAERLLENPLSRDCLDNYPQQ